MTTIAIIGSGYMGRTHAEAWHRLGLGNNIKYVCSRGTVTPIEHAPAAQFVTDLNVVLEDADVDIVSVCTPTPTHRDIAERALAAHKNVLLEKPITLTAEDALALAAAAERSPGVLMIAQVVRFFGGYRQLREHVASGAMGDILSARARRFIQRPGPDWWHDETLSGGVTVDFAIHDYDQMNLFLGEPISVSCIAIDRLGPIETTIRYRNGTIGQVLSHADLHPSAPFTSSIGLVGTTGFADYEFSAGSPTSSPDADGAHGGVSRLRFADEAGDRTIQVVDDEPYTRQAEYFLQCVTQGTVPTLSSTASATRALEVALAARRSLQTGTPAAVETGVNDLAAQGTTLFDTGVLSNG